MQCVVSYSNKQVVIDKLTSNSRDPFDFNHCLLIFFGEDLLHLNAYVTIHLKNKLNNIFFE